MGKGDGRFGFPMKRQIGKSEMVEGAAPTIELHDSEHGC